MLVRGRCPTVVAILLAGSAILAAAGPSRLAVAIDPQMTAAEAVRDGVTMGLEEAERAAVLLGRALEVSWADWPPASPPSGTDGLVVAAPEQSLQRLAAQPLAVPVIAVTDRWTARSSPPGQWFVVEHRAPDAPGTSPAGCDELRHQTWDGSLQRYGAGQLNERFERRFGRPMSGAAWAGWAAVKALTESVLRATATAPEPVADALRALRFDGHKGRALHFDASQRLVHPYYAVATCGRETRVEEVSP